MSHTNRAGRTAAAVTLLALALGCGTDTGDTDPIVDDTPPAVDPIDDTPEPFETADRGTTTVADIVGDPETHMGEEVTLVADVDEVFGPRAFTVDEDDPLAGGIDNDLLVLGDASALPQELDDQWMDDSVRITGEVALLTADEIQTRLGWEPSQELRAELEGRRAVLIAKTVNRDQATNRPAE